jgi:hypothetical protein
MKMIKTSLAEKRPDLLQDWDYSKNTTPPDKISFGSKIPLHWKCHVCNHEWVATANTRTSQKPGHGCRVCGYKKQPCTLKATVKARQIKDTLNCRLTLYSNRVGQQVTLKCPECKHEWVVTLQHKPYLCPYCNEDTTQTDTTHRQEVINNE